jgi:sigma-B regulation protein RsbU (phosphoserine phosphatase)
VMPEVAAARFAVCHRPRSRAGGDFYDVQRLDENHLGFFLADVMGHGSGAGSLIGSLTRHAVVGKEISATGYKLLSPEEVLSRVNRELLALGLEEPPFVAMLYGVLNARTGDLVYARAGLPPPVFVPVTGVAATWSSPGSFLGVFDAAYPVRHEKLPLGSKFVVGTDGTRPDGDSIAVPMADPLRTVAESHRELTGQKYVDAVAQDLLTRVKEPDDFTLLAIEMRPG